MHRNVRTILLILFLIIIPFLIYAFLQVRSLSDDEKMADTIYEKQMEAVLFSLNQYADEVMGQWIKKLTNDQQSISYNANDLILANESIQMLVLRQMNNRSDSICLNDYVFMAENAEANIDAWYKTKDSVMVQLSKYLAAGFQKIQSADDWISIDGLKPSQAGITVMTYDRDSVLYNALFVLEPGYWVEQFLGAKMQEFSQGEFRVGVIQQIDGEKGGNIIYNTDTLDVKKDFIQKPLWILPDTYLSIQPIGESYSEIIRKRSRKNLTFLFFSVLTVLVGAYIIMRNIRSALKIAQLKSDFVSNVSHEIRTPLSLIRMYAETLMLGRLPSEEKKQQYYEVIHHESGRLAYLVNNILDFSRIEANRKTYQMVDHDMNKLVEQTFSNYSYSFKEKGVACKLTLFPDEILVKADPQAFEEALSNLIHNAIKYSDKKKDIEIITSIDNGYGCCAVVDKGIGIAKAVQGQIFEKFYRAEGALTQKTKGTGLGLSLVKHIVASHGGEATVASKLDVGSTFTLKFPLINREV